LEAISDTTRRLYLDSDGTANDVFRSGRLTQATPGQSQPDHYTYDPLDVRPGELEQEEIKSSLTDQRAALNLYGNGLVYHSEPFEADTENTGYVKLVAWMALDVPDTDFAVSLGEMLRDGSYQWLTQAFLRARYRESLRHARFVPLGEIVCYEFQNFMFFSRRVAKGSRLRLLLSSPNSIHIQKNYNSGGVVAAETAADARTAHVTLYHDAEHPSYLELPLNNPPVAAQSDKE
jgi:putative CocE/NonD family hydrolase